MSTIGPPTRSRIGVGAPALGAIAAVRSGVVAAECPAAVAAHRVADEEDPVGSSFQVRSAQSTRSSTNSSVPESVQPHSVFEHLGSDHQQAQCTECRVVGRRRAAGIACADATAVHVDREALRRIRLAADDVAAAALCGAARRRPARTSCRRRLSLALAPQLLDLALPRAVCRASSGGNAASRARIALCCAWPASVLPSAVRKVATSWSSSLPGRGSSVAPA